MGTQIDTAIFEDRTIKNIKNMFKRYVSDKVVDEILRTPDSQFLTGKRQELTVLFADIRGFTDLSENMEPEMLVQTINEFIETAAEEILKRNGMVDKIVGDEVMALFGVPIATRDHAKVAIKTAIAIQNAMECLRQHWLHEGRPAPSIGIGINSGEAIVGNIGCEKASDYTAVGVNVNIAARLCGEAKAGQILISDATYNLIGTSFKMNDLGHIKIKGIQRPIDVYEIISKQKKSPKQTKKRPTKQLTKQSFQNLTF